MTLDVFMQYYKAAKDKAEFVGKHIVNKYVDYQDKISLCKKIVDFTSENVTTKDFEQNTPLRYMFFVLGLVEKYTDIEFDYEKALDVFNALEKDCVTDQIVVCIPEREYDVMQTILNMCVDDYMENTRSMASFLDTKFKSLGLGIESLNQVLSEAMQNPEILKMIQK